MKELLTPGKPLQEAVFVSNMMKGLPACCASFAVLEWCGELDDGGVVCEVEGEEFIWGAWLVAVVGGVAVWWKFEFRGRKEGM
jgi:hypothetical protein